MWFLRLSAVMQFPIRKYLAPALEAGLPPATATNSTRTCGAS